MRIESIKISQDLCEKLGNGHPRLPMKTPLNLNGFGKCVVIAGKNGSGKTRLFDLIYSLAKKKLTKEDLIATENSINALTTSMESAERSIKNIIENGNSDELERIQISLNNQKIALDEQKNNLMLSDTISTSSSDPLEIAFFVPKSTDLKHPAESVESDAIKNAERFAHELGPENWHISAPAYARAIMRAAASERGSRQETAIKEKRDSEERLHQLFKDLLGEEVSFKLNDTLNIQITGLTDRYDSILSQGQKVLFQLACMLHARNKSLKDCIIFLDEPENHLHPSALNEFVDSVLKLLTNGQLWIATHSVPLIAHLSATDPDCLWFAENGKFSRAGRSPGIVLNSLLGGDEGARRVNDLTLLASRYASFLLLRQCLLPPGVIEYSEKDPQLDQIRNVLEDIKQKDQPLTILDFGAGKGRLIDAIAIENKTEELSRLIDYIAYEPSNDVSSCQKQCEILYSNDRKIRAFDSLESIISARGEKFAHVAIVCNVLHEVRPDEWIMEFGSNSALCKILRDDGYILLIEDYAIPVGERAHEYGFLLLDDEELRILFDITDDDVQQKKFLRINHSTEKYKDRLVAHAISTQCLNRITEKTRWNSIKNLHKRSLARLKDLLEVQHDSSTSSSLGRESALVTQLVANSALWLNDHS